MAALAIKGGTPVRHKPICEWPIFDINEEKYLLKVLKSREWGKISGKVNEEFEKKFSSFQGVKHTVTVCNGTVALRIALYAAGIGPGDEVIVPSYTFVATASSVIEANAVPVFCDINDDDYNISPDAIKGLITERTKAIMPVHFGGAMADMKKIMDIAKSHNLVVIEDAAQAQGSTLDGIYAGTYGDAGTFSFQSSKNITSGEGGAVITNNDMIAEKIRSFHNCGRKPGKPWYFHYEIGGNYRLSEFQAAVLMAQLEREDKNLALRRSNAQYMDSVLSEVDGIKPVIYPENNNSSYYLYVAKYNSESFNGLSKQKFIQALNAEGIPVLEGYPFPLYKQPLFQERNFWKKGCPVTCSYYNQVMDYTKLNNPIADKACNEGFWFPNISLHGSKEDIDTIVEAIYKIKNNVYEILEDGND